MSTLPSLRQVTYFLGGYYLVRLRPLTFGSGEGAVIHTASDCINDNLVGSWPYPSIKTLNKEAREAKREFRFDDSELAEIRGWIGSRSNDGSLGWLSVFSTAVAATEYKEKFFPDVPNVELLALYFDENEMLSLIEEFKPESEKRDGIGIYQNLVRRITENEHQGEQLIGYDLVGFEYGGDFHTFHCHGIGAELSKDFGLRLNGYGLFEETENWKPVLEFLNDEDNGCEPVPWFVSKVKIVKTL
jgi:hypothetical protein